MQAEAARICPAAPGRDRRRSLLFFGGWRLRAQDRVQKTGKPQVQILTAKSVHQGGPFTLCGNNARLSQYPKVMREG